MYKINEFGSPSIDLPFARVKNYKDWLLLIVEQNIRVKHLSKKLGIFYKSQM